MKQKRKIRPSRVWFVLIALVASILIMAVRYKESYFDNISLDELIFYATNDLEGVNPAPFIAAVIRNILPVILLTALFCVPIFILDNPRPTRKLKFRRLARPVRRFITVIIFLLPMTATLFYANQSLELGNFIVNRLRANTFFADHYVDPAKTKITFPEQKRNLIYIYLESMENTLLSEANGGQRETSVVPELEAIALDPKHINFSHNDKLGGATITYGSTWTIAGLTAQSTGLPLLPMSNFKKFNKNSYDRLDSFLPGAYSLGEVLQQNDYSNTLIIGSDANFGGRANFFTQHGNYQIHDFITARERGLIDPDYKVWWGYEDKKLYQFAKDELTKLAKADQPFNFQMLTVDTHFVDGWLDETCPTPYEHKYDNVHACASTQLANFLNWLKKQPFYDNTTVVITGDHLGMQTEYYDSAIHDSDYERSVYNVFINSQASTSHTKNRRFSSFDYYPTVLTALGATVEGDKLGLGVNLFSDKPTLFEQYGPEYVNQKLSQRQKYYYKYILQTK